MEIQNASRYYDQSVRSAAGRQSLVRPGSLTLRPRRYVMLRYYYYLGPPLWGGGFEFRPLFWRLPNLLFTYYKGVGATLSMRPTDRRQGRERCGALLCSKRELSAWQSPPQLSTAAQMLRYRRPLSILWHSSSASQFSRHPGVFVARDSNDHRHRCVSDKLVNRTCSNTGEEVCIVRL